jgi:hypothetical protein
MPLSWIPAVVGGANLLNNVFGGSGGGGASGSGPSYVPTNLSGADQGWQSAFGNIGQLNDQISSGAKPLYDQTLQNQTGINYTGMQNAANQAGQQYGNLAGIAGQQMNTYGNQANLAGDQQKNLYGAANQIYQTAFDPNNAQFNQLQQQLSDQVNAGQAQRGLGNSPVGGSEFNNAMQNLDLGWHTQQLQNQATGLQAMGQASNAGGAQGQLVGANLAGQLAAGQNQAGYTQQAGNIPTQMQEYVAGRPAAAGAQYAGELQGIQAGYGNQAGMAIPYMNAGQGAQQWNANYGSQQNAAASNALMQGLNGMSNSANNPGSWLNNIFGGGSSSGSATNAGMANSIGTSPFTSSQLGQADTGMINGDWLSSLGG